MLMLNLTGWKERVLWVLWQTCNGVGIDGLDISKDIVDLEEGSGVDGGVSMPNFEMLVQADPYQGGSGPLLGATVYRDHPEPLSDDRDVVRTEEKEEEEIEDLLSNFLSK